MILDISLNPSISTVTGYTHSCNYIIPEQNETRVDRRGLLWSGHAVAVAASF